MFIFLCFSPLLLVSLAVFSAFFVDTSSLVSSRLLLYGGQTKTPLDEAILKFLKPLQTLASNNIAVHLAAFEIHIRRGKVLLMLQAIKRAQRLDADHPDVHRATVRFLRFIAARQTPSSQLVEDLLASGL